MTRSPIPAIGATLLASLLGGCMTTPPPGDTGKPGLCNASTLAWTIGQPADASLVERAQREAGAKIVRVLKPGQVVTMEYSDMRLNLHVDAANRVTSYSCS